jgi:hypothetical protein
VLNTLVRFDVCQLKNKNVKRKKKKQEAAAAMFHLLVSIYRARIEVNI